MRSSREGAQHALCIGSIDGFSECDAVEINDGVRCHDHVPRLACGNGIGFCRRVERREVARGIAGPISFIDFARKHANVQTE
jgi:hypothetical protein